LPGEPRHRILDRFHNPGQFQSAAVAFEPPPPLLDRALKLSLSALPVIGSRGPTAAGHEKNHSSATRTATIRNSSSGPARPRAGRRRNTTLSAGGSALTSVMRKHWRLMLSEPGSCIPRRSNPCREQSLPRRATARQCCKSGLYPMRKLSGSGNTGQFLRSRRCDPAEAAVRPCSGACRHHDPADEEHPVFHFGNRTNHPFSLKIDPGGRPMMAWDRSDHFS
jgi:hypothetical protein